MVLPVFRTLGGITVGRNYLKSLGLEYLFGGHGTARQGTRIKGRDKGRRLVLEPLEDRRLLSWAPDDFGSAEIDTTKWSIVDEDNNGSWADVWVDGNGHLNSYFFTRYSNHSAGRAFVTSEGVMADEPWTYYTSASFNATADNRSDFDLGYHFEMSDGGYAFLEFDSINGMRLKYGNQTVAHGGPTLYPNYWYELKFSWDGTELQGWYREDGRTEWQGGYPLYSSTTAHPERVQIGQVDTGASNADDVGMTLLVDYWQQQEPTPAVEGFVEDLFDETVTDPVLWRSRDYDSGGSKASVSRDAWGRLVASANTYYSGYYQGQAFVETVPRMTDTAWEAFTAMKFEADVPGRSDLDLGWRFEMANGSYAYLEFDSVNQMRLKYGNEVAGYAGPSLYQTEWYELKFAWDGDELRAWYREQGRSEWLGDFVLYSSVSTYPERIKFGQTDIRSSSADNMTLTLWVDYWQFQEPAPVAEGAVVETFFTTDFDASVWQIRNVNTGGSSASVRSGDEGSLITTVSTRYSGYYQGWAFAETIPRLPASAWESYTSANFTATAAGRSDLDLGWRFEMSDGSYAYLEWDSVGGARVKYGTDTIAATAGATLLPDTWYEMKFVWDGSQLRAYYRMPGETTWQGDYLLMESTTAHPERVKIGQTDLRSSSNTDASATLRLENWETILLSDGKGPQVLDHTPASTIMDGFGYVDVNFSEAIDPASFTVADVSLTGPSGAIALQGVMPLGNRRYRIEFAEQEAVGAYTLSIGPNVSDVAGNLLDQDQDGTPGEAGEDVYTVVLNQVASATSWAADGFDGTDVDTVKWSIVDEDNSGSWADVTVDGAGHLNSYFFTRYSNYSAGRAFVTSEGVMADEPWTYYTSASFSATVDNRSDFDLGYHFEMSDGGYAFLEFDSVNGARLKYGNQTVTHGGATLYPNYWYELKFSWDGTELYGWYREEGRTEWQGGYPLYSSTTAHPERVQIGQVDTGASNADDVGMTLLVDYWSRQEPMPDPIGPTVDEFGGTDLDSSQWQAYELDNSGSWGDAVLDGTGHLKSYFYTRYDGYRSGMGFAEATSRLPESGWEAFSAINFNATVNGRSDFDLGYHFETSDGGYAFLEFDSINGMRLKYGNQTVTHGGPTLYPNYWYELKFSWDGTELRGWLREEGRTEWQGGYLLYSSTTAHPERVQIGQVDTGASNADDVGMTLLVDYWQQQEPTPAVEGFVEDLFDETVTDPVLWRSRDYDSGGSKASVSRDAWGRLVASANTYYSGYYQGQAFVETVPRMTDTAWEAFTAMKFEADVPGRSDLDLGWRFEMANGSYAYLEFDSVNQMRLKYGNEVAGYAGPSLYQTEWYELKFAWDGDELRAWYREQGRSEWLGDFVLYSSVSTYPERIKFGQTDIRSSSTDDMALTLWVDYWQFQEPAPVAEGAVVETFQTTDFDASVWQIRSVNTGGSSASVRSGDEGRLIATVSTWYDSYYQGWAFAETIPRLPASAWESYTSANFTATAAGRSDLDLGWRFEMSDGSYAYLEWDSVGGARVKYGTDTIAATAGATLLPDTWYEMKFGWDGSQLRAFYRMLGETTWQGDYLLIESATAHPERVKIGQTDLRSSSNTDASATLRLENWETVLLSDGEGPQLLDHTPASTIMDGFGHVDVSFSEAIDPASFTVADVSLTGPSGAIALQGVTPLGNRRYRIVFAEQEAVGAYTLSIGPNVSDAAGNLLDQDQDGMPGEAAEDVYTVVLNQVASATSWASDGFGGTDVDTVKWSIVDEDNSGSWADVTVDGGGHLKSYFLTRYDNYSAGRAFVTSEGVMADEPWTYYTSASFSATVDNRSDFDLGYHFSMSDGGDAYLEFDSVNGARLKYGNQVWAHGGATLYPNYWYELKFNWDGTELRAWYRDRGRSEWQGGYLLYSSTTAHPQQVQIGQVDAGSSSNSDVAMTLLVDYWSRQEPMPDPIGPTVDEFEGTDLDSSQWQAYELDNSGSWADAVLDGNGHLKSYFFTRYDSYRSGMGFAEATSRLPDSGWEAFSAINFNATVAGRSDFDLGYHFEMSDGGYALLEFDSVNGMRLKYGNQTVTHAGVALNQSTWYEIRFTYDGVDLRGWYREQGAVDWLGDFLLYSSVAAYPERVRIGQMDVGNSSNSDVGMTLLVDYWNVVPAQPLGAYVWANDPAGIIDAPLSAVEVVFNKPVDAATFTPSDVELIGPDGPITVTTVTELADYGGRRYLVGFSDQTKAGRYYLTVGPDIADGDGRLMDADRDETTGERPDDQYFAVIGIRGPRVTLQAPNGRQSAPLGSIQVTFDRPMDQSSFSLADDIASLTLNDQDLVATGHTWLAPQTLEVTFNAPVSGLCQLVLGPDILDLNGVAMDQDEDAVLGEVPDDRYIASVLLVQSGSLTSDTVWNSDYGTIIVDGTVTVPAGITLTIEAGTVVKFTKGSGGLMVRGTLDVEGVLGNGVVFTSIRDDSVGGDTNGDGNGTSPATGDWTAIKILGASASGIFQHADVRYASYAIYGGYWDDSGGSHIELKNTILQDGGYGAYVYTPYVEITAENCVIANNAYTGVFVRADSRHVFRNCTIVGNGFAGGGWTGAGVHVGGANITLENTIVAFNADGLHHQGDPPQITIRNSNFYNPTGLEIIWDGDPGRPDLGADGNFVEDPRFVNYAAGNYELDLASRSIDSGLGTHAPATDILGRARHDDGGMPNVGRGYPSYVDRGAYERQQDTIAADLAVSYVADPEPQFVNSGETLSVSWSVINQGLADAAGAWQDRAYLSNDPYYSSNDILVATYDHSDGLAVGQTYTVDMDVAVPASNGPKYLVVQTGIGVGFLDAYAPNNRASSMYAVGIDIPMLEIGVPQDSTIQKFGWSYFRLDAEEGRDLLVNLDGTADRGSIYVYARFGAPPTLDDYDYAAAVNGSVDQELYVGDPAEGSYFVGLYAPYLRPATANFTIVASYAGFDVETIVNSTVGAGNSVTLELVGQHMSAQDTVYLVAPDGTTQISAVSVYCDDPEHLYPTFDLTGWEAGLYDVVATSVDSDVVTLTDGLTVADSVVTGFRANLNMPGGARPGRWIDVNIVYRNTGNVDVPSPLLRLLSTSEETSWSLPWRDGQVDGATFQVLGLSPDGPATLLRPGQTETLTVQMLTPFDRDSLFVSLYSVGAVEDDHSSGPINWVTFEAAVKPSGVDATNWTPIFANLQSQVGPTWGDYVAALRDDAERWFAAGRRVYCVRELWGMEMDEASGRPGRIVTGIVLDSASNLPLTNVLVQAHSVSSSAYAEGYTSPEGRFYLYGLESGAIEASVEDHLVDEGGRMTIPSTGDLLNQVLLTGEAAAIRGTVYDINDSPKANAELTAYRYTDGAVQTVFSASDGSYDFGELEPGYYWVECSAPGRATQATTFFELTLGFRSPDRFHVDSRVDHHGSRHRRVYR